MVMKQAILKLFSIKFWIICPSGSIYHEKRVETLGGLLTLCWCDWTMSCLWTRETPIADAGAEPIRG